MTIEPKHFEDIRIGDQYDIGSMRVDREQMLRFAAEYDPQPIHLDDDAAKLAGFKEIIASGWHTTSLSMTLMVRRDPFAGTRMLGFGADRIRWPNPVYPGDVL